MISLDLLKQVDMAKIYHNPRCAKSRQTLKLLEANETDFEVIEYLKSPPTSEELKSILSKLNLKPLQLIRKHESIFKEHFKAKNLSDNEWIEAMIKNPILIERPIVIRGSKAILGRPPENLDKLY